MCCGCKRNADRSLSRTCQRHHRAVATCVRPRSQLRAVLPSRARPPLLFRLRAGSWPWLSRKSDDLGCGIRSRRTASAACDRATCRRVLTSLIGDELVEIGGGVHAVRALRALADDDVAEIARGDVRIERLDGAAELARGLVRCTQSIRRGNLQVSGFEHRREPPRKAGSAGMQWN